MRPLPRSVGFIYENCCKSPLALAAGCLTSGRRRSDRRCANQPCPRSANLRQCWRHDAHRAKGQSSRRNCQPHLVCAHPSRRTVHFSIVLPLSACPVCPAAPPRRCSDRPTHPHGNFYPRSPRRSQRQPYFSASRSLSGRAERQTRDKRCVHAV